MKRVNNGAKYTKEKRKNDKEKDAEKICLPVKPLPVSLTIRQLLLLRRISRIWFPLSRFSNIYIVSKFEKIVCGLSCAKI